MSVEKNEAQAIWNQLEEEDVAAAPPQETAPEAGDDAPEADSKPVEPAPEAPAAPSEPESTPAVDPVRQELEELKHLVKSTVGRVGALQSELQKIGSAAATRVADSPSEKQIAAASADPEKWSRMKEDFPDWAEAVEAFVSSRAPAASGADPKVVELEGSVKTLSDQLRETALDAVALAEPDYETVLRSEGFGRWFKAKSPEDQQRLGSSMKASVVISTIRDYRKFEDSQKAKQTSSAKKVAAAAMPSGVTPPLGKSPDDMSPQELWAYLDEQERRGRRA
jgi:hypothetical protein